MSKLKKLTLLIILMVISRITICQEIANVLAKRVADGIVEIKYDLISPNHIDTNFYVELYLYQEDKLLFKIENATGAIGFQVFSGVSNKIIWNPFINNNSLLLSNARFKITAIPRTKLNMALIIGGIKKDSTQNAIYNLKNFYADKMEVSYLDFKKFLTETKNKTDAETTGNSFAYVNGNFEDYAKYNWQYNTKLKKIVSEDYDNFPVIFVSFNDAKKYCEYKKKRLPTSLEWEIMALNCFENPELNLIPSKNAWFEENSNNSYQKINSLNPNELGLFHIFGNVSEWCNEDLSYHLKMDNQENISQIKAVARGGSYITNEKNLDLDCKTTANSIYSYQDVGFRCVCNVTN